MSNEFFCLSIGWWKKTDDEPIEPTDAVQPTPNAEQNESIIENVDDPQGSPAKNPSKKARNTYIPASRNME